MGPYIITDRVFDMKKVESLLQRYSSQIMYLIFGVLTTIINIVVFISAIKIGVNNDYSNILAWLISVAFAYVTNRIWVFGSKQIGLKNILVEMGMFFLSRIVTLGFDIAIVDFGVKILRQNPIVWKLIDNVVVIILNYVFSKIFVFKDKK